MKDLARSAGTVGVCVTVAASCVMWFAALWRVVSIWCEPESPAALKAAVTAAVFLAAALVSAVGWAVLSELGRR